MDVLLIAGDLGRYCCIFASPLVTVHRTRRFPDVTLLT
jgi:hypothetical protein